MGNKIIENMKKDWDEFHNLIKDEPWREGELVNIHKSFISGYCGGVVRMHVDDFDKHDVEDLLRKTMSTNDVREIMK